MILVDTSVWIDHFRRNSPSLVDALHNEEVLTHPFVIGEIACGSISRRADVLTLLDALPKVLVATDEEALQFIVRHDLGGKGIGYVDVHLLAATSLTGARLWTHDRRLASVATTLGINVQPEAPPH